MERDDSELVRLLHRAGHGDQSAFATLYEHTSGRLFGVCVHLLGQREQAEEVLQEAFVRIWHQAGSYSPARGGVMTWMISIARYRAIDQLRHSGRHPEADWEEVPERALADAAAGPQESSLLASDADALARCLDELSDTQRRSIQLAFLQGLSHHEICHRLDRPLGSVKSWIRRGLEALKRCLGEA